MGLTEKIERLYEILLKNSPSPPDCPDVLKTDVCSYNGGYFLYFGSEGIV
jgi:hypothetical protein